MIQFCPGECMHHFELRAVQHSVSESSSPQDRCHFRALSRNILKENKQNFRRKTQNQSLAGSPQNCHESLSQHATTLQKLRLMIQLPVTRSDATERQQRSSPE
eukprot:g47547.t1